MKIIEEKLIKENVGLIWKMTEKFYNVDKQDLFQAGALGLIKAFRNFDKSTNTKFSTYAYDYIFGEMYNLANNKEIKVSRDLKKLYIMIEKCRFTLAQKLNRIPNNEELARYLEMDQEKIEQAILCGNQVCSIDQDTDEMRSLHETIASTESVTTDDKILIDSCLDTLKPVEKDIIQARYFEDLTQSETARKLGITQVMVSRYESKSLEKMHEYMYM